MKIFAQRLKELRKENKRTQSELAEILGITARAYQYYEGGEHYPDVSGLMKLADYFGVTRIICWAAPTSGRNAMPPPWRAGSGFTLGKAWINVPRPVQKKTAVL